MIKIQYLLFGDETFFATLFLQIMMTEEEVERNYTCKTYRCSFSNNQNLRRHETSQHKNDAEQFACRLCDQTFARRDNME